MKIILDIPDGKVSFAMQVLKSLSFIKKVSRMSDDGVKLWEDLKESAKEVRLHKQGKLKLKSAQDLLHEL